MTRALLQQALDALNFLGDAPDVYVAPKAWAASRAEYACSAIKAELAKPERKPMTVYQMMEYVPQGNADVGTVSSIVAAVEKFHGIKDTP